MNFLKKIWNSDWAGTFIVAPFVIVINVFFLFNYVVGVSMMPGIQESSFVVSRKVSLGFGHLERGDLVIANRGSDSGPVIKRVIAIPEDVVEYRNGIFYINGKQLEEPYVLNRAEERPLGVEVVSITLKEEEYFIAGDNRNASFDSRHYGPIHLSRIKAIVLFVMSR